MSDVLAKLLRSAEGVYPPVLSFDDIELWPNEGFHCCVAAGLLRPSRPASHVFCYECGESEEVVFLENSATKKPHAYSRCAEAGPVEVPIDRLKQWEMSYQQLMDAAFTDAGLSGRREEVVRDRIWRLGKANWGGASRNVFFARGLHRSDAWQVMNQGQFTTGSVVFVPARLPPADSRIDVQDPSKWRRNSAAKVVQLKPPLHA